jgi:hypothetical protein
MRFVMGPATKKSRLVGIGSAVASRFVSMVFDRFAQPSPT